VVPGDLVVNRFVFGSGDEFVEVEFGMGEWRILCTGLSLMVWEPDGGKSHTTAIEVGLALDENKYVSIRIEERINQMPASALHLFGLPWRRRSSHNSEINARSSPPGIQMP